MKKQELISAIALATGDTAQKVESVLESFVAVVASTLREGGEVEIRGFGKFKKKHVAARNGRNPATGEAIQIPAKFLAKFYSSKSLDEQMN